MTTICNSHSFLNYISNHFNLVNCKIYKYMTIILVNSVPSYVGAYHILPNINSQIISIYFLTENLSNCFNSFRTSEIFSIYTHKKTSEIVETSEVQYDKQSVYLFHGFILNSIFNSCKSIENIIFDFTCF